MSQLQMRFFSLEFLRHLNTCVVVQLCSRDTADDTSGVQAAPIFKQGFLVPIKYTIAQQSYFDTFHDECLNVMQPLRVPFKVEIAIGYFALEIGLGCVDFLHKVKID